MPTYLSIPYSEKEEAKKFGARWDPKKKLWFSPDNRKELLDRWPIYEEVSPIIELIGEVRGFGSNTLFVDLVPRSCWFTNVRKCVDFTDWDRLRRFIYERANYQCECCRDKSPLDAHERWHFNEKEKIQKLMRIIALCKSCHEATHMGLAQIRGRDAIATEHLMKVTGMNKQEANAHINNAFDLWEKRNIHKWDLDLTIITNSGIKLVHEFNSTNRNSYADNETIKIREIERNSIDSNNGYSTLTIKELPTNEIKDIINNKNVSQFSKNEPYESSYKANNSIFVKIKLFFKRILLSE